MNVVSHNTNCCARKINVAFDAIFKCLGSNDSFTPALDLGDFITISSRGILRRENVSDHNFRFQFVDSETVRYIACNDATLMTIAEN